jgi:hypothetical protein
VRLVSDDPEINRTGGGLRARPRSILDCCARLVVVVVIITCFGLTSSHHHVLNSKTSGEKILLYNRYVKIKMRSQFNKYQSNLKAGFPTICVVNKLNLYETLC